MESVTGIGGGVGWDSSLLSTDAAADAAALSASDDFDPNALIERTQQVTVDVNDYSRFKHIGESDSEDDAAKKDEKAKAKPRASAAGEVAECRNCHKPGAKLKCSVCKKAVYCARACQASDWTFHKRICKKPEPPKAKEPPRRPPPASVSSSSSSSSSTPSSTSKASSSASSSSGSGKKNSTGKSSVVVADEPDLPADIRGYKNGLPYFHRELSKEEKSLIGDIAPQKIEPAAPIATAPTGHEGSAWNAAGTFEERTYTKWAEQKLGEVFTDAALSDGNLHATLKAPEKITGDASICVVRGKKRYLFDLAFKLPFEVAVSGGGNYKGSYTMNEISNDEDYEISYKLTKKPTSASELAAIQKFVGTKQSGLQSEVVRLLGEFAREFQNQ